MNGGRAGGSCCRRLVMHCLCCLFRHFLHTWMRAQPIFARTAVMRTPRTNATKGWFAHRSSSGPSQSIHDWPRASLVWARGTALSRCGPRGGGEDCCGAVYRAAARFLTEDWHCGRSTVAMRRAVAQVNRGRPSQPRSGWPRRRAPGECGPPAPAARTSRGWPRRRPGNRRGRW